MSVILSYSPLFRYPMRSVPYPGLLFENYRGTSAMRESCLDLTRSAMDGGHRMLVFSQFTTMLALLEDLKKEKIAYYKITG